MKCAVMGAGAWGTALASLLADNGHETTIWCLEPDVADTITHSAANPRFLPGAALSKTLRGTTDKAAALDGAELVLMAAPSHVLREVVSQARGGGAPGATAVVATKGIERHTFALMTEVAEQELHGHAVVALSGPSFAAEVANRQPTAVVAASTNPEAAALVQQLFSTPHFRVYSSDDVIGVELGGALKNVMAVAAGMSDGLGLGFNTRAALITRGLAEMMRLGMAMGAHPQTFAGLAGMGDLVLTCTGALSRNRQVGLEIGKGATLPEVLAGRETVAEGVVTTESARELAAARGVEMPIVNAVHRVLFEHQPARSALVALMSRELRGERD